MAPPRALHGALKPLTSTNPLLRPSHYPITTSLPTQIPRSRSLSSAHPATSTDTEHPAPHSDHYDPPSGWLFNVPPGEKYKKEGWEGLWVWGFWGGIGAAVVAYCYKPDTSIQTWALEEARRRLEAEGILPDPSVGGVKK